MKDINEEINLKQKKDNIINGIMKSRGLYLLVANAKVGKSMLALQLAHSLATNQPFLGYSTTCSYVLYITTESDFSQIKERQNLLGLKFPPQSLQIIDRDGKGEVSIFDIEADIAKFADNKNGRFLIIDMLKDINLGVDYNLNDYQDVAQKLLPKLRYLAEKYNLTILFTHHLNKRGDVLGSSAFTGVVDGKLKLTQDKNDPTNLKLKIINRDFPELNINLKREINQIFSIADEQIGIGEMDFNIVQLIKYISSKKEVDFTCSDVIIKANMNITPKQLGKLFRSNKSLLKSEGITITLHRSGKERLYKGIYEEVHEED